MPAAVFRRKLIKKNTGYLISVPKPIIAALGAEPREVEWIIEEDGTIRIKFIV